MYWVYRTLVGQRGRSKSRGSYCGQIEAGECLLPFGAGSFVFRLPVQKYIDEAVLNYNFACFVWV